MRTIATLAATAALATAGTAGAATSVLTPYTLAGTSYSQNFNTLAASGTSTALPAGFQISETGSSAAADGAYTAGTGSNNAGDVYSFGTDADRALGSVLSGTNAPLFGAIFTNGLGTAITSLGFAFTGEQWRSAVADGDRLNFQYLVGASAVDAGTWVDFDALDIVALVTGATSGGALNGNLAANRASYAATITGLNIAAGQRFGFRFVDADGAGGADAGLAVDDLTLTATTAAVGTAVPEPATWAMLTVGFGLLGASIRRRTVSVALA